MVSVNRISIAVILMLLWFPGSGVWLSQAQSPATDQYSKVTPAPVGEELGDTFREAARQHKAGNLETAARLYQQILNQRPQLAEVHNNLGLIYQAIGNLELAQKEYQEAVRLVPDYALALNNLASFFFLLGQYENASEFWFKAARKDPFDAEFCFNLGLCYFKMSSPEKAIRYLQLASKLNRQMTGAPLLLGQLHFQRGEYAAALQAYQQYLKLAEGENSAQVLEAERQIKSLKAILGEKSVEPVPSSTSQPPQPVSKALSAKKKFFLHPARLKQFVLSIFSRPPRNQTAKSAKPPRTSSSKLHPSQDAAPDAAESQNTQPAMGGD